MGGAISAGGTGELPDKNTAFLEFKKSNAGAKLKSFIKTSQEKKTSQEEIDVLVKNYQNYNGCATSAFPVGTTMWWMNRNSS